MSDTVLVTGAGGFVGSAVVRLLVQALEDNSLDFSDGTPVRHVVALLRPGGSLERLRELSPGPTWSIEYADLTRRSPLSLLLEQVRPRTVMHLALDTGVFSARPQESWDEEHAGPLEVLFERLTGVPGARVIHTGSAWVLPSGYRLDEETPLQPRSRYARAKARLDALLPSLQAKTGVSWINLRLFNIFGRYERPSRLLPSLVADLSQGKPARLSDGNLVRDFNDVEVIAQAYLAALQAEERACGQVYHIGSGRGMSVRDFALTVAEVTGNADLIQFGAVDTPDRYLPCQVADPTRAERWLGWSHPQDVEDRIRRAATWWLGLLTGDPPGPRGGQATLQSPTLGR